MPVVKNSPAEAGDRREEDSISGWGRSPGRGHGSPFSWRIIPRIKEPGGLQSMWLQRIRHD